MSCPIASVFAPPAVIVIVPSEAMVPARSPAVPADVDVIVEKLGTAPTDTAEVGTASPWVYDWLKENASPGVSCVTAIVPGEYTPLVIVPAEMVLAVDPSVVSTPLPLIVNEEPSRSAVVTEPPTWRLMLL